MRIRARAPATGLCSGHRTRRLEILDEPALFPCRPGSPSSVTLPAALSATLVAALAGTALPAHADPGLSLAQALRLASEQSRQLAAKDAQASAARDLAAAAGQRPDPQLKLGINNLPLNGPDRLSLSSDFMTMRSIGLAQEFTREGKLQARSARYAREADVATAERALVLAGLRRDTATAWLDSAFAHAGAGAGGQPA